MVNNKERRLYQSPANFGWGTLTLSGLAFKIFINAITGVIIVSLLAFLEEIGWRAWMLPKINKNIRCKKRSVDWRCNLGFMARSFYAKWYSLFERSTDLFNIAD